MPESPASDGSTEGQAEPEDPVHRLANALRDLWTSATEAEPEDGQSSTAKHSTFGVDQLSGILRGLAGLAEIAVGERDEGHPGRSEFMGGMVLLGQAYLVATVSGLRFWRRVAQSYGRHQSGLLQALIPTASGEGLPEAERRVLVDEIRGYLREIGDISAQEARSFQSELDRLAELLARAASGSDQASDNQRRWKAKP